MRVTRMIWYAGTMLTALAMLAATASAAAQEQGRGRTVHARTGGAAADSSAAERRKAASLKGFRGIATRLNTTPEALQYAFEQARLTNPNLSRGNFIAANVLAADLGPQHPNITTQAILSGLQSGNSLGQTLQGLGLSASEAKQATKTAEREAKRGERDDRGRAKAERKQAKQKSERGENGNQSDHR